MTNHSLRSTRPVPTIAALGSMYLPLPFMIEGNFPCQPQCARAQEVVAADESEALADAGGGPQDLPGRAKGERSNEPEPEPTAAAEGEEPTDWLHWETMTGDWWGRRPSLEDAGFSFAGSFTQDWMAAWSGGLSGEAETVRLFDFNLTADLEKIAGIPGATLFADYYIISNGSVSGLVGDFQGVSNIEAGNDIDQLAELWYEQWMCERLLRLKVGKVDGNSEFGFVNAAGGFVNSAFALTPATLTLPTYPDPAMSVNLFWYPTERCYVGLGWYDGAANDGVRTGARGPNTFFSDELSDDYFYIAEFGCTWETLGSLPAGRFDVGAWHHDGDFAAFAGGTEDSTQGFYAAFEQCLWQPEDLADAEDERGLCAFAAIGWGDEDVNPAHFHLAGGLALTGTFAGRDADACGLGITWVDLADDPGAGYPEDEATFEAFYVIEISPWLQLKPDLQYVVNPGGANVDDALVAGLRVEVSF